MELELSIVSLAGDRFTLIVEPGIKVKALKQKLCERVATVKNARLLLKTRELSNDETIEELTVPPGASLTVVYEDKYQPRSKEELTAIVQVWTQYVHPRAQEFFATTAKLEEVLMQLASCLHRNEDPIFGDKDDCVIWYGDVTVGDVQATIQMFKPGEVNASVVYVNRILCFIFANDDSFEELLKLPKEPFKMCCGDQLCVNLAHILVGTQDE